MSSSAEDLIFKEVSAIFATNGVKDYKGFYSAVTKSIWKKEKLPVNYDKFIPKPKQQTVWNAIEKSKAIADVLERTHSFILEELSTLMQKNEIDDEDGLYARVSEAICSGDDFTQFLEASVGEAQLEELKLQLQASSVISGCLARPKDTTGIVHSRVASLLIENEVSDSSFHKQVTDAIVRGNDVVPILEEQLGEIQIEAILDEMKRDSVISPYLNKAPPPLPPPHPHPPPANTTVTTATNANRAETTSPTTPVPAESHAQLVSVQAVPPPAESMRVSAGSPLAVTTTPTNPDPLVSDSWLPSFRKHVLPSKLSLGNFHKVEACALQKSSTLQLARDIGMLLTSNNETFNDKLISTMFYLLKRSQELAPLASEFVNVLVDQELDASVYSLRMLVNVLLANCDSFLRQKLVNLLNATNPVPLTEFVLHSDTFYCCFTPEPYWLLDSSKFLFFSYALDSCKGKSSLLNKIFGTTFELSNDSHFFNGTIDYQGDKMFVPSRGITCADAHGKVDLRFKNGLRKIADGVIIQVSHTVWMSNPKLIRDEVEELTRAGISCVVIVVRDVAAYSNKKIPQFNSVTHLSSLDIATDAAVIAFLLPNLNTADSEYYVQRMREKIVDMLESKSLLHPKKDKQALYLESLDNLNRKTIIDVEQGTSEMFNIVAKMIRESRVDDPNFLPIYPTFARLNKLRIALKKAEFDHNINKGTEMQIQMAELSDKISKSDTNQIGPTMTAFEKMITAENNVRIMYRFVEKTKTALAEELAPTRAELIKMKDEIQQKGDSSTMLTSDTWQQLNERLDSKTISIEIFWREINQLFLLHRPCTMVFDAFVEFTKNADPFEIIDGDNHSFPDQLLSAAFKNSHFDGKRILVVGVIGPQNTGKSTLLNFMFGCVFTASDGRTTKGVYGSLVQSPKDEYDYLLILDTEGIHSIEKNDPDYDRKVVLFTLAVCDVVIINVKDEISSGMSKTFEICAKSLQSLKNNKMPQPVLFFVQNQKADTRNIQLEAMQNIIAGIEKGGLQEIITLSTETFVALPSAFNTKDIIVSGDRKWRKLETSPDFIEKVTEFTAKVFSKVKDRQEKLVNSKIEKPFQDLTTWISFASNVFLTVDKFEDLTRFADIQEQLQDKFVSEWVQGEIKKHFSDQKKAELLLQKNIQAVATYFLEFQDSLPKNLQGIFDSHKISTNLHLRHRSRLELLLERTRTAWNAEAKFEVESEKLQQQASNGQYKINKKINEILRSGKEFTEKELEDQFQATFKECVDDLKKQKEEMEEANKQSSLTLIDTYKLYCLDLPSTVRKDLEEHLGESVEVYGESLVSRNLANNQFIFIDQSTAVKVNSRLTAGEFEWTVFHSPLRNLITQAKTMPKISNHRPELNEFIKTQLNKPTQSGNWFTDTAMKIIKKFRPAPQIPPAIHESWVVILVDSVRSTLNNEPKAVSALIDIGLPFRMVLNDLPPKDGLPASDVIQQCVALVEKIINDYNEELACFGMSLTQLTKGDLHMLMLHALVTAQQKYHSNNLEATVAKFLEQEKTCKDNFLEQTSTGPNCDTTSVAQLGKTLEQTLLDSALTKARELLSSQLRNIENTCTRAYLQSSFEQQLLLMSMSEDKVFEYVTDPISVLTTQFDNAWKKEEAILFNSVRTIYKDIASEVQKVIACLNTTCSFLQNSNMSVVNQIFTAPAGADAKLSLLAKSKAAIKLLEELLTGKPTQNEYLEEGILLKLTLATASTTLDTMQRTPTLDTLLIDIKKVVQISNVQDFVSKLIARLTTLVTTLNATQPTLDDLDNKKALANVRAKSIGCKELCPCCKRCCDVDHTKQGTIGVGKPGNKHMCIGGHQYRGMAGYKLQNGNYASLKICSSVNPNEKVQLDGLYYTWRDFKLKFATWEFDRPVDEAQQAISDLHNKMARTWTLIGPRLCKKYGINYTIENYSEKVPSKHFIFALDASGSMSEHWAGLKTAVGLFAKGKETQSPVEHLVSCITFDNAAYVDFSFCPCTANVFDKAHFTNGGTNFNAPMKEIVQLVEKTTSENPVVIVFMSDGEASFPSNELNSLVSTSWDKIESFWAVGFGDDSPVLKQMANHFVLAGKHKGTYKNPKQILELQENYMEIARQT